MKIERMGEELFWALVWVFSLLIVGYFILNKLSGAPYVGGYADWVASHASNTAY